VQRRIKRLIGGLYSGTAGRLYEPAVVHGGFRLFGGRLNELVLDQGRRAVTAAQGRPILDIPAGTGYFTAQVAKRHDVTVVAADYATGMARRIHGLARRLEPANLHVIQGDIHDLPFRDHCFGSVLCTNGLQVIPDVDRSLSELARVLVPGGVLLVSVLTAPLGAALPDRFTRKLPVVLRSGRSVADAIFAAGLMVTAFRRERLAHLIEAVKVN
jgi:ubiquinone/menaquinone biosynthesis C-methylase UbiE